MEIKTYQSTNRFFFLLASVTWLIAGDALAQFCPEGTTYFSTNYFSCTVGSCWSATPFSGSTAVSGNYPNTNYACAATTRPAGAQENTLYTYDGNGNLLISTDPLGHSTGNIYDALNRITQVLDPNTGATQYAYDPANNLSQVADPRSLATVYTYDGLNSLSRQVSPDTGITTYTYDAAGNVLTKTDARGVVAAYAYDGLNRATQIVYSQTGTTSETHTFTYDTGTNALGRLSAITDPTGNTYYHYDSRGRVTQKQSAIATGAGSNTLTTGYAYNAAGQLTQLTYPSGVALSYGYDGAGRVQSLTATLPGTTTCPQDVSSQIGLNFGPAGTQSQKVVITNTGSTPIQGPINLVVSINPSSVTLANATGTTGSCNPPSSRAQIQVWGSGTPMAPNASVPVVLQFNNPNQSTYTLTTQVLAGVVGTGGGSSTVTLLSNTLYEPFGPPSGWRWGNGLNMFRDYDLDGRLASWEFRDGVSYLRKDYSFDSASRIVGISDPNVPTASRGYQYDILDRLIVAESGSPLATTQQFSYDAVSNRLTQTTSAGTTTFAYSSASNRLQALSGAQSRAYGYDGVGNPTTISGQTNVYNNANRLVAVQSGANTLASYQVNALGQRVSKTAGGSTTLFAYDEQGHLLGEYDGSGNLAEETVWLGDLPVATLQAQGGQIASFYVHADHLGSPRAVTRPSDNAILWQWDNNDPFGANAANENPAGAGVFHYGLRFPGQYYDAETGTHYNYFRDYDPTIGRYEQSDPIGLKGGLNSYSYLGSAPLSGSDPRGLVKWRGEFGGGAGAYLFAAGAFGFRLTSDCACGKRLTVTGFASSLGGGLGGNWNKGEGSGAIGASEFKDDLRCPDADVFNGVFLFLSIGAKRGVGYGCEHITLGGAYTEHCGWGVGWELGAVGLIGASAWVTRTQEPCCE